MKYIKSEDGKSIVSVDNVASFQICTIGSVFGVWAVTTASDERLSTVLLKEVNAKDVDATAKAKQTLKEILIFLMKLNDPFLLLGSLD